MFCWKNNYTKLVFKLVAIQIMNSVQKNNVEEEERINTNFGSFLLGCMR